MHTQQAGRPYEPNRTSIQVMLVAAKTCSREAPMPTGSMWYCSVLRQQHKQYYNISSTEAHLIWSCPHFGWVINLAGHCGKICETSRLKQNSCDLALAEVGSSEASDQLQWLGGIFKKIISKNMLLGRLRGKEERGFCECQGFFLTSFFTASGNHFQRDARACLLQ